MKYIITVFVSLFLIGCDEDNVAHKNLEPIEKEIKVYIVNGQPLECIAWLRARSCNWEKHNKHWELLRNNKD